MTRIVINKKEFEENMKKALWGISFDIQEALKNRLTREHGKDTGELQSSIQVRPIGINEVEITMSEHGKYVEFGTPPHSAPPDELEGWAERKLGSKDKKWLVWQAIKKRGTKPYPFIRPVMQIELADIISKNLKSAFK